MGGLAAISSRLPRPGVTLTPPPGFFDREGASPLKKARRLPRRSPRPVQRWQEDRINRASRLGTLTYDRVCQRIDRPYMLHAVVAALSAI